MSHEHPGTPQHQTMDLREEQEQRLRASALALQDLYQPGGELMEWTRLDGEEIIEMLEESSFQNQ
jgi:hypothetical protein